MCKFSLECANSAEFKWLWPWSIWFEPPNTHLVLDRVLNSSGLLFCTWWRTSFELNLFPKYLGEPDSHLTHTPQAYEKMFFSIRYIILFPLEVRVTSKLDGRTFSEWWVWYYWKSDVATLIWLTVWSKNLLNPEWMVKVWKKGMDVKGIPHF